MFCKAFIQKAWPTDCQDQAGFLDGWPQIMQRLFKVSSLSLCRYISLWGLKSSYIVPAQLKHQTLYNDPQWP